MLDFVYHTPTKIIFGADSVLKAAKEAKGLGATKVLVHYGSDYAQKSGLLAMITDQLLAENLAYCTLGGVVPNPRLEKVREGIALGQAEKVDFILAVGGGSVLDSAKAIALGLANPNYDIWDDIWLGKFKPTVTTPLGVVLTLSATGSETSDSAVITNRMTEQKRGMNTVLNRPLFAILDPKLTMTLPKFQIACGVTDMMMHTMERFFTPDLYGNVTTDNLAAALLKTIISEGAKAYADPKDYGAMSEIMWCGSLAHIGLTGLGARGDWATHQLGHALSLVYDVAHGASLSAVWGSWARYSIQFDLVRFVKFAEMVWDITEGTDMEKSLAGIKKTEEFWRQLDMPISLSELGCKQDEAGLTDLAHICSYKGGRKIGSYPVLDEKAIRTIYAMANA